ncbi:MAG: alkaline phosphatase family protein [Cyanobacteria bacterium P01_D01_bin.105]
MTARLLMIGLDGADGDLIEQWSSDGSLPHLAALRKRGKTKRLSAPEGITDDGLWASFQFACGLGEHGRYYWEQRLASGEMGMSYQDERDRDSFWHTLSRQGHRVAIFDIPKCGLPKPLNGIHLSSWIAHGHYLKEPKSYPPILAPEVVRLFGAAPLRQYGYEMPQFSDEQVLEIVTDLKAGIVQKRKAGCHFLSTKSWDLFTIAFKAAHCAGHSLWNFVGSDHPRGHNDYDEQRNIRLGEPLKTVFVELDAAIGALVAAAGSDAQVVVFSTSDMQQNNTLGHLMPEIISRLNRTLGKQGHQPYEILPYNGTCAAIQINLPQRRFSWRANRRYRAELLAQAYTILSNLTDADTGEPVVTGIDRLSAEQPGKRAAALPNLLLHSSAGAIPRAVISPQLGLIEAPQPTNLRPGDHAAGGLIISSHGTVDTVNTIQDLGAMAIQVLQNKTETTATVHC